MSIISLTEKQTKPTARACPQRMQYIHIYINWLGLRNCAYTLVGGLGAGEQAVYGIYGCAFRGMCWVYCRRGFYDLFSFNITQQPHTMCDQNINYALVYI